MLNCSSLLWRQYFDTEKKTPITELTIYCGTHQIGGYCTEIACNGAYVLHRGCRKENSVQRGLLGERSRLWRVLEKYVLKGMYFVCDTYQAEGKWVSIHKTGVLFAGFMLSRTRQYVCHNQEKLCAIFLSDNKTGGHAL